jgi:hypothetical protein
MHLSRSSIQLTKARHRPSLLSRQSSFPLKVKYQSQNYYRWTFIQIPSSPLVFSVENIPSVALVDQGMVQVTSLS